MRTTVTTMILLILFSVHTSDSSTDAPIRTLTGHTHWVRSVAYSPDGTTLATGSNDKTARMWDTQTGVHIRTLTGHRDGVHSGAFIPVGLKCGVQSGRNHIGNWEWG